MRYGGDDLVGGDGVSDKDVWGSDFSGRTRKSDCEERVYEAVDCGVDLTDLGVDSTVNSGRFTMVDEERGDREAGGIRSGVGEPSKRTTKL